MVKKIQTRKIAKLARSFLISFFRPGPVYVYLWATKKCDLACDYCFAKDNNSPDPSTDELKARIDHSDKLGAGLIAFFGGEPTLRKDLGELITHVDKRSMYSYVSTHGKSLDLERLNELADAGLDVLEVSIDGYDSVRGSRKTLDSDESLINRIEQVSKRTGLRYKAHQMLTPDTVNETPKLVELAIRRNLPMSFGLITHTEKFPGPGDRTNEDPEFKPRLKEVLQYLAEMKKQGAPIINPRQYFIDGIASLDEPVNWKCYAGTSVVYVTPDGKVFDCSRHLGEPDIDFLTISHNFFRAKHRDYSHCGDCLSAANHTFTHIREHPIRSALEVFKIVV